MDSIVRKNTGSYYTCNSVADYIAKWAIDSPQACVLEPSFGDGIFIDSALSCFAEIGNKEPSIIGVEIQKEPYDYYIRNHSSVIGYQMDFMDYQSNTELDAIIGNPPYVSLKNLEAEQKEKTLQLMRTYGIELQTSSSLWMPFVIHSTELLKPFGKLGFVLPYEITHVRYAFDLWKYLSTHYGKITICRVFCDFFPEVDVETIIFLAEKKGEKTNHIFYKVFNTLSDLYADNACHSSLVSIDDIITLKKPFVSALVPSIVNDVLIRLRKERKLAMYVRDCKFKIGYVTGNKRFFHPSAEKIRQVGINFVNLKRSLLNAKRINANNNVGIATASICPQERHCGRFGFDCEVGKT